MKPRRAIAEPHAAPPPGSPRTFGASGQPGSLFVRILPLEVNIGGHRYLTEPVEILARLVVPGPEARGNIQPAPDTVALAAAAASLPAFSFRKAGSHWDVRFDGSDAFHLPDSLGAKYLDYLLHHPNAAISAFDLENVIQPEKAGVRRRTSTQDLSDKQAVQHYLRELQSLRLSREQASERSDYGEVDRLDHEIAQLEAGLGNSRQPSDTGERARNNVRKAISAVRDNLRKGEKFEKDFGQHIGQFVNTGYECIYNQPAGRIWG